MSLKRRFKVRLLAKAILNGVLGIASEAVLALAVILAGFLTCLAWWGIFR